MAAEPKPAATATSCRARGSCSLETAPALRKHLHTSNAPQEQLQSHSAGDKKSPLRSKGEMVPGARGHSFSPFHSPLHPPESNPWGFRIFKTKPPTERKNPPEYNQQTKRRQPSSESGDEQDLNLWKIKSEENGTGKDFG